jgi:6-phosphogluconolactonase
MHSAKTVFICFAAACVLLSIVALAQTGAPSANSDVLVYFGTYTTPKSKGIYVSRLDLASGSLSAPVLAAEATSPSFLAVHPSRPFLYAVNEVSTFDGKPAGSVSAFAIDRVSGALTALNQQPSGGGGPAHLSVDRSGRSVLVANYGGGSVAVLPIDGDGRLKPATAFVQHTGSSVNPQRQKQPHAHAINVDPANRFAYVPDLGLDKVMIYRFDAGKGSLEAGNPPFASVPPGSGPRHIAVHPNGRFAYVINEMTCTISVFGVNGTTGALQELDAISTLPAGQAVAAGFSTAEIMVHPSGRFLYGSNRGHDTIAAFAIDPASGKLTAIDHTPTEGRTPRGFGIDPTGAYLLVGNQRSDSVVMFRVDTKTGRLTSTGQKIEVGAPVSVEFVRR